MSWAELCGASVLASAGRRRGEDLALVASALGAQIYICPRIPSPVWVRGAVWRAGSRRYQDDQVDLARAIAVWATRATGHYLDPAWLARFVRDVTPCRSSSCERASARVRVLARG